MATCNKTIKQMKDELNNMVVSKGELNGLRLKAEVCKFYQSKIKGISSLKEEIPEKIQKKNNRT